MIFETSQLKQFLKHISDDYIVVPLSDWDGQNSIILRHDVDLDIDTAYDLALLEEELGIRSSFFILMSSHCYNPNSRKNRDMLVSMSNKGFDIGLHFDPSIYSTNDKALLQKKVEHEAHFLSEITGCPVKSISIHNPKRYGEFLLFDGFVNAYSQEIFSQESYISDSRMTFRHDIYDFVKRTKKRTIQILLHPEQYTKTGGPYSEIFKSFFVRFATEIDSEFGPNVIYRKDVKDGLVKLLGEIN